MGRSFDLTPRGDARLDLYFKPTLALLFKVYAAALGVKPIFSPSARLSFWIPDVYSLGPVIMLCG